MLTNKQIVGEKGEKREKRVIKYCFCPKCKKKNTLRRLSKNFKCADIICDFCGYLAQVKTSRVKNLKIFPKTCLGGA